MLNKRQSIVLVLLALLGLLAAACGDDGAGDTADGAATTADPAASETTSDETPGDDTTGEDTTGEDTADDAMAADDGDACERNTEVGTITVVTGFDYAASPGIIDPIVAKAQGYYDQLCLDVVIQPGFAPGNHALVASGAAQFANAGSFGEVVKANVDGEAGEVVLAHYGRTAIDALVVPADSDIATLDDLPGHVVGIKGDLPYGVQMMLGQAGINRLDLTELLLDTYDPVAGFEAGVEALPVYKSNEPIQLANAGFDYRMFDPLDYDVPASFGMLVVGEDFLAQHPAVVEDFMRATLRGMAFAVNDPEAAVGDVLSLIGGSEASILSEATEIPRWDVERQLVVDLTPEGEGYGIPDLDRLGEEVDALTRVGVFADAPDWGSMVNTDMVAGLYNGGTEVAWEPYRAAS